MKPQETILSLPPKKRGDPFRHVALLVESSGSYGRGLLGGISQYNRERGNWSTYYRPHGLDSPPPAWLSKWKGDGIIVRVGDRAMVELIRKINVPTVNLRGVIPGVPFPYVGVDNVQVAQIGYQHLKERGLVHFAFCGKVRGVNPVLDNRCDEFINIVQKNGGVCDTFNAIKVKEVADWEEEQDRLCEWLKSLPRPVGIMACNDERGLQVLDACRRINLAVPDEVVVIGVDNDAPLCDLAIPPLTSVDVNAEGVGYEAAALLDRLMDGKKPPTKPVEVSPRGVVVRHSTDLVACEDEEVGRAVRYIREHACNGLQVVDVLAYMGMSRTSLQQRMKEIIGRTIHQEIARVRLQRVKELLTMSNQTIKQVARDSGFASVQYMTRVFRAMTGETPARFREQRTT